MSIYKELSYDRDIDTVKGIRFCILSPDEILRMSVAEITKTDASEPVVNGLYDARMGVLDHNKVCQTCEQKNTFCPGHFGHIKLVRPVFYIQFFDMVKKILKSVCFRCSRILVDPEAPEVKSVLNKKYSRQKRWEIIYKMCNKKCPHCGAKQADKISREPIIKVVMEWKDVDDDAPKKLIFNADDVLRIFQNITDKDCDILGFSPKFSRPEWMICTVLPVPPPAVRPYVKSDTGQRSEDDLTHKLCDIIKSNKALQARVEKGLSKEQIDVATQVLQYHVATFIDNQIPGINPAQQRTGRLIKSLSDRLKGKEGRIRGNLMGKRVDFSARSVITPDPNISIDELGVPIKIAMNLTFPEIVNKYNRDKLMEYVRNGPDVYPGAKFIRKPSMNNRTFRLKNIDRSNLELEDGDIVERHMMDGDYVLFNRQPSLHKCSMQGHRVRIMPFNTFRLNLCVCKCYNADMDGDEMNLHLPQSLVSMNELRDIAAVPTQIISVRECKPIISIVQDTALGVYRLTKGNVMMDDKTFFNLMARNTRFFGNLPKPVYEKNGVRRWSGRQVLSSIIPKNINIKSANRSYDETKPGGDKENYVVIENGEILQGRIDTGIYQNRTKGLVHSIYSECGAEETRQFFDNTQTMICDYLVNSGFSVGISDMMVDDSTKENLKKVIHDMKVKVYDIIRNIHIGRFDNKSIENNNDYFEQQVNMILNQANTQAGKLGMGNIDDMTNRMINMVKSGSKGNVINVAQMLACLGQQNVDGKRIIYGFENRTLPHYTKYDDGPESRGFVENSFVQGLSPQEFFFHAMGGREGLIDTAVKTSETGYIQRKLVKAMEDCKVAHDCTVRNAGGNIVQFLYGEDGMDPTKIESQSLPFIDKDYPALTKAYLLTAEDDLEYIVTDSVIKNLHKIPDWEIRMRKHFDQILEDREFMIEKIFKGRREDSIMYPVSFARIINTANALFSKKGVMSDLCPMYVLNTIEQLCNQLKVGGKYSEGNLFIQILIRCYLSPKQMVYFHRFDKIAFDYIVREVRSKFYDAINNASEMVGVIAAQSIGEPATQLSVANSSIINVLVKSTTSQTFYRGTVGEFIDKMHEEYKNKVFDVPGHQNSTAIPLQGLDLELYIIGVSDNEKTSWKKISEVSRHPANGGMVKVTTKSGKSTTATLSHSFLKRSETKVVPVLGSDLKIGDRIPVAKFTPTVQGALTEITMNNQKLALDFDLGWLCGAYIADGCVNYHQVSISKVDVGFQENLERIISNKFEAQLKKKYQTNTIDLHPRFKDKEYTACDNIFTNKTMATMFKEFGTSCATKNVPAWVFSTNLDFIKGVIGGYFDGDGNVADSKGKGMIRCHSVSEKLIDDMIILLSYVGIFGSKCLEAKNKKIYGDKCMDLHTIQIPRKYAQTFKDSIGFVTDYKASSLDSVIEYVNREDRHSDQEFIDKIPELGNLIASIGKALFMGKDNGWSRTYGRWAKKDSIGRETLKKYIKIFEDEIKIQKKVDVEDKLKILRQAAYSDVVWDEIVALEYLDDPKEFVYDFTVPGNDSFMVDTNVIVHNTLNTFHSSGVSSASKAVRGVPRIKELLSVSKNQKAPSMIIALKPDVAQNKMEAKEVMNTIQTIFFADVVKSSKIYYDPDDFKTTIESDKEIIESYREFIESGLMRTDPKTNPWLLRFELDKEKMKDYDISMNDINAVLLDHYNDDVMPKFSDDNSAQLILRIRLGLTNEKKTKEVEDEEQPEKDYITELKALEKTMLENLMIKGIKKVNKAAMNKNEYMKYNKESMQFEKAQEWVIETAGTNLLEILGHPHVDPYRTISNDVIEIYELFGIEAARQALYNELNSVIKDGDMYINYRHLALLVDTMTNRGYLMSIDRHGINRVDIGPLAKCSFEEVTDMLTKAGVFAEIDRITGISANVMLGQIPKCGTGDTQIILDEEIINKYGSTDEHDHVHMDTIVEEKEQGEEDKAEDVCTFDELTFDFRVPDVDASIKRVVVPEIVYRKEK